MLVFLLSHLHLRSPLSALHPLVVILRMDIEQAMAGKCNGELGIEGFSGLWSDLTVVVAC